MDTFSWNGVSLGKGAKCPIRDLSIRKSCRVFEHVLRSVLPRLFVILNAGSLEKEDGVTLETV